MVPGYISERAQKVFCWNSTLKSSQVAKVALDINEDNPHLRFGFNGRELYQEGPRD